MAEADITTEEGCKLLAAQNTNRRSVRKVSIDTTDSEYTRSTDYFAKIGNGPSVRHYSSPILASVSHPIRVTPMTTRPLCSLERTSYHFPQFFFRHRTPKSVHSLSMSLKFEGETSVAAAFAMKRHSNVRRIQLGGDSMVIAGAEIDVQIVEGERGRETS